MPDSPRETHRKPKSDWFAEWFDSPYYHQLYRSRDEAEARRFIDRLVTELNLQARHEVLDLACGRGRHARSLGLHGLQVTGLDLSPQSIAQARTDNNLPNVRFAVHDMREVYRPAAFDAVLNLFTSFGYFDSLADNRRVVEAVHVMLRPGGLMLIDFLNAEKVIANLVEKEVKSVEGIDFFIERSVKEGRIVKDIAFEDEGQHFHFTERVQALTLNDFQQLFDGLFSIEQQRGSYDWQPFAPTTSDRLILVARRMD